MKGSVIRSVRTSILVLTAAVFAICATAHAERFGKLQSMKLMTSTEGWAADDHHLFWTADAGSTWSEITPKIKAHQNIDNVFFLNTAKGWILLVNFSPGDYEANFDLAATQNAGRSWSITHVNVPGDDPSSSTLTGGSHMVFVDDLQGRLNLLVVSGATFHLGVLLETVDGGRTWRRPGGGSGTGGEILFTDPRTGWATSGDELWVTRNGAASAWLPVSLKAPSLVGEAIYPTYRLPVFIDAQHGFLPVTYSGPGVSSAVVLFATKDGGSSWQADRFVFGLDEGSVGMRPPLTITDGILMIVGTADLSHLKLLTVSSGQRRSMSEAHLIEFEHLNQAESRLGIREMSFADSQLGWALATDMRGIYTTLVRTKDGGKTWTDITPHAAPAA
jgi:photosystem II stability/assembly factor-like uncharacterized protein